ncbi:MAG TPA: VOC family protein [Phenylobacterium sp.]|jgi:catechol 2,3-dioxygenase-like lactoylglutathione lyase family enzyme
MAQLETLKKQAKQLVRWHRDGVWTVAQRIRDGLPRCAGLDDREILDRPFPLAEAQELIARELGRESWAALIADLDLRPTRGASPASLALGAAEPTLFVSDLPATLRFFNELLGFATVFTYGQPPFFGQVGRDAARINLRHVDPPVFAGDIRAREHLIAVNIAAPDVKALYGEYQAAGVTLFQLLRRQPWGAQDFVVQDPDGNLIGFVFNPSPSG